MRHQSSGDEGTFIAVQISDDDGMHLSPGCEYELIWTRSYLTCSCTGNLHQTEAYESRPGIYHHAPDELFTIFQYAANPRSSSIPTRL